MKETFEKRKLTGSIKVKLEEGRYWEADKFLLVQDIKKIVDELSAAGHKLTLRQLYYQLVSKDLIPNHVTVYKKLGKVLDDCRYSGQIDWDAIEDRGRIPFLPYWVLGVEDAIQDTINRYRLNRQKGQSVHVEMWTEKDAISGILKKVTNPYHVRLAVNKGYTSSSALYRAYRRFLRIINQGAKVIVLYFGDHDPSGINMVSDIKRRISNFLHKGEQSKTGVWKDMESIDDVFQICRIGLTMDQVKTYNLPPNPAKMSDPRAKEYVMKYGKLSWEVDALSPDVLMQIVSESIEDIIDIDMYNDMRTQETSDKKTLEDMMEGQSASMFNDPDLWGEWTCPVGGETSNDPESIKRTQCPNGHSVALSDVIDERRKAILMEE